jgi:NAD(P)-dependent dehydrogenase (short-subunit alcohol dehydrogenase family)
VLDGSTLADEINAAGGEAMSVITDVSDTGSVNGLVAATLEAHGKIDVLVNNAALFAQLNLTRFEDIDEDEFDAVMRVNVRGVWQMSKAVVPEMRKRKYGKIINIASGTVFKGSGMMLHYVSSKGAVVAMTRAMAREVGDDNICVNTIAPGLTASQRVVESGQWDESLAGNVATRCIKREEEPEDLVGTVIFLSSREADFITGQVLAVDGGSVAH